MSQKRRSIGCRIPERHLWCLSKRSSEIIWKRTISFELKTILAEAKSYLLSVTRLSTASSGAPRQRRRGLSAKRYTLFIVLVAVLVHGCARTPKLLLSPNFAPYPVSATGTAAYHTVERGQTLYRISKMYHVEVSELMRANHIDSPSQLATGQRLFIPGQVVPVIPRPYEPVPIEKMRKIVGPNRNVYHWQTITIHHSGTLRGGARLFDRDHRRRRMGGLFYHFVIGNGSYTSNGAVEVGWRWKKQVKANRPYDIQLCLVGNFNKHVVSEAQLSSLVNLIKVLRVEYNISLKSIRKHEDIKGTRTECPGKNFPFGRLLSELSRNH